MRIRFLVLSFLLLVFLAPQPVLADEGGVLCHGNGYVAYDILKDSGERFLYVVRYGTANGIELPNFSPMKEAKPLGHICLGGRVKVHVEGRLDTYGLTSKGKPVFIATRTQRNDRINDTRYMQYSLSAPEKTQQLKLESDDALMKYELRLAKTPEGSEVNLLQYDLNGNLRKKLTLYEQTEEGAAYEFEVQTYEVPKAAPAPRPEPKTVAPKAAAPEVAAPEAAPAEPVEVVVEPGGAPFSNTIDLKALSMIGIHPSPLKDEVRGYIAEILAASKGQDEYLPTDPQVGMLKFVGSANSDELLSAMKPGAGANLYLAEALRELAGEDDRFGVIKSMKEFPVLVNVVVAKRWEPYARGVLLERLQTERSLPPAWIEAVVALRDPLSYPLLKRYLIEGSNRYQTWLAIRDLEGIKLKDVLPQAWERARSDRFEVGLLAGPVLDMGYRPALEFCIEHLEDNNGVSPDVYDLRALVLEHTGIMGSNEEIQRWYQENRNRLVFDLVSRRFLVR